MEELQSATLFAAFPQDTFYSRYNAKDWSRNNADEVRAPTSGMLHEAERGTTRRKIGGAKNRDIAHGT